MKYEILLNQLRDPIRLSFCTESDAVLIKEAADAIEELQKQLREEHAKNLWIPVTERLPENDKTVLVWNRRNSREYFDVYDHERWIILESEDITHWMPLPEPPKEETDG